MSYYTLPLKAGQPYKQETPGTLLLIDGIEGAASVDVTLITGGQERGTMPDRKTAFKMRTPFDAVIFTAADDCVLRVFLTFTDVSLGFTDGAAVTVAGAVEILNDAENRVPVDIGGGTVTVTADNVGVSNTDANPVPVRSAALAVIVDHAPATINTGAGQLLVSDATLRRLRIRNAHATAVIALGGAAVTLANAAIVLQPGDMWIEDDAAGAAWYATSDTAAADVRVVGLK